MEPQRKMSCAHGGLSVRKCLALGLALRNPSAAGAMPARHPSPRETVRPKKYEGTEQELKCPFPRWSVRFPPRRQTPLQRGTRAPEAWALPSMGPDTSPAQGASACAAAFRRCALSQERPWQAWRSERWQRLQSASAAGAGTPAVWALTDKLCTVPPTLGCQACAVQGELLFADHSVEGHGLGSEVSETRISMHSAQRQASS